MTNIQLITCVAVAVSSAYGNRSNVRFQAMCNYVMSKTVHFATTRETFSAAVQAGGDLWILNGCNTPAEFDKVNMYAMCYPWDRSMLTTRPEQLRRGAVS